MKKFPIFILFLLFCYFFLGCRENGPTAFFTINNNRCTVPCTITFQNQSVDAKSAAWDFGDNTPVVNSLNPPGHLYEAPGTYAVSLVVKNKYGSDEHTELVNILPVVLMPEADFEVINDGCTAPCVVSFINKSKHADAYEWDFGDNTPKSFETNPPPHRFDRPGEYTVVLKVSGTGGTNTTSQKVVVKLPLPIADFSFAYELPTEVVFTNTSLNATTYDWDFGDGSTHSNKIDTVHEYQTSGNYTVVLTVRNNQGKEDKKTKEISVNKVKVFLKSVKLAKVGRCDSCPAPSDGMSDISFVLIRENGSFDESTSIVGNTIKNCKAPVTWQCDNCELNVAQTYYVRLLQRDDVNSAPELGRSGNLKLRNYLPTKPETPLNLSYGGWDLFIELDWQ